MNKIKQKENNSDLSYSQAKLSSERTQLTMWNSDLDVQFASNCVSFPSFLFFAFGDCQNPTKSRNYLAGKQHIIHKYLIRSY